MASLPANFCVAPFLQLTTHPTTSFSPCPYLGGTTWKGQYPSIMERWTSPDLENLRTQFKNNQQPEVCGRCWHEETNQKKSLRLRLYDPVAGTSDYSVINNTNSVNEMVAGLDTSDYLHGPKVLTIKNGNVCNAKCRSCHPGDSSRWLEDSIKLKSATNQEFYSITGEEKNWTDQQVDEIFELSRNLVRLELFGGEPLYNKKVLRLLDRIVENGHSKNLNLYINTNGSVDLIKQVPQIKEFKEIEIGVSIDDIGARFDYLRHGLDYQSVINNVRSWQQYFSAHGSKYFIDSITTVSVYNILYLPEIKQQVMQLLPQAPFWNLLVNPDHMFIKNMPDQLKALAIARLSTDPEFDDLIQVIQQPADPLAWQRFLTITTALDTIRNENFRTTFPELANALVD